MKNFKLILMVVLALMFSSNKAFATDDWGKALISGVKGVLAGDTAGVSAGLNNFATTTPVLSTVYSGVQWTGAQLGNIRTDIGNAISTGGALGLGSYALTAPLSGLSKVGNYGLSTLGSYANQVKNSRLELRNIDASGFSGLGDKVGKGAWVQTQTREKIEKAKVSSIIAGTTAPIDNSWRGAGGR